MTVTCFARAAFTLVRDDEMMIRVPSQTNSSGIAILILQISKEGWIVRGNC
jgi:hypothetical protein